MTVNANSTSFTPSLEIVRDLLHLLKIPHQNDTDAIIQTTDERWGRKPGMERWELPEPKVNNNERSQILNNLKILGVKSEIRPALKHYRYLLILGATVPRMKKRLTHLVSLWHQGLRADEIVFLTGQRPLNPVIDKIEELTTAWLTRMPAGTSYQDILPENETEAAKLLFHLTELPEDMHNVKVSYVDTPRFLKNGRWERPYTALTAHQWLQTKPEHGTVLAFSDQPHARYQYEALKEYIPAEYKLDVTAPTAREDTPLAEYLDALALWLKRCDFSANQ